MSKHWFSFVNGLLFSSDVVNGQMNFEMFLQYLRLTFYLNFYRKIKIKNQNICTWFDHYVSHWIWLNYRLLFYTLRDCNDLWQWSHRSYLYTPVWVVSCEVYYDFDTLTQGRCFDFMVATVSIGNQQNGLLRMLIKLISSLRRQNVTWIKAAALKTV